MYGFAGNNWQHFRQAGQGQGIPYDLSWQQYKYQQNILRNRIGYRSNMPLAYNTNTFGASTNPNYFYPNFFTRDNYNATNTSDTMRSAPITLSWNVNAYVEEERPNFIKRCIEKRKKNKNDSEDTNMPQNVYGNQFMMKGAAQPDNKNIKHILKDVNGIVSPGELCAIMGASGAGKTTLLNVLNFRNRGKLVINGDIKVNGRPITWKSISKFSGYVQQEDVFIGTLKVKEHLMFQALLRMDRKLQDSQKLERVQEVMTEMNLNHVKDTLIGGQNDRLKGISGGEKRRLCFATEVLTHPQLLFCDEPTTGLDAFMALSIVESMNALAKQGKTIICTIHQPSSQIFEKFSTLCLLAEGRVAFMGPLKEAEVFFKSVGNPVPHLYNPADHYIQVLAVAKDRERALQRVSRICDEFQRSKYQQNVLQRIAAEDQKGLTPENINETKRDSRASYFTQIRLLIWRQSLNSFRDPLTTKVLFAQSVFIAVFFGLIYLQIKKNEKGVQDLNGLLFLLLMNINFGYVFPIINSFPFELAVFYRETKNRVYSILPYYIAKMVSELPKYILFVFIQVTILYWMANILNNGKVYVIVTAIYIVACQVGIAWGFLLSVLAPSAEVAVGLVPVVLLPLIIYGGFFLNSSSTPVYFIWIKYISWFFYSFNTIATEVWSNVDSIKCTIPLTAQNCTSSRCFKNGDDVLNLLNIKKSNFDRDIGLLMTLFVVPHLINPIVLYIKTRLL